MASVSAATDSKLPLRSRRLVRCAAYLGVMDRLSSELLGFAPDARVLIVNCDDFGMHDAVNAGVVESIEDGIASSCSLMAPCPAAANAMRLLRERPHIPFGIHLALIRDSPEYAGARPPPRPTCPLCSTPTQTSSTSTRRPSAPRSSQRPS